MILCGSFHHRDTAVMYGDQQFISGLYAQSLPSLFRNHDLVFRRECCFRHALYFTTPPARAQSPSSSTALTPRTHRALSACAQNTAAPFARLPETMPPSPAEASKMESPAPDSARSDSLSRSDSPAASRPSAHLRRYR